MPGVSRKYAEHKLHVRKDAKPYQIKLNSEKRVFGVPAEQLLGFLVSEHGIEASPEKIKAIECMCKPTQLRDVQKFTGCLALADEAFWDLKRMLSTTPVLAAPADKEALLLYIPATSGSISTVLVVERPEEGKIQSVQRPVYYLSEVVSASKQNYPHYQKMCYDMYLTAKKLKQYFQDHTITMVSTAPISEIMGCRVASGRVAKWVIELASHTILYEPRTTIKSHALAYFLIHFAASNNIAEYEALVHGLRLAKELGIWRILCYGDSDLVVQECSGEWDARDANMAYYRFLVQQLSGFFDGYEFLHEPRAGNESVDMLAKIGSSRQAIPSGVSLEYLRKPFVKPSPDSESVFIPDDPAAPLPYPGPGAADLGPGAAVSNPVPGAADPSLGTAGSGSGAAAPAPVQVVVFTMVTAPATAVFQRCIEQDKGIEILLDIHQGECGHHAASRSLVAKAFRHGFYWPTAFKDAESLVLKCEGCQCFGKQSHQSASAPQTILITWPFAVWGLDMWIEARPIKKLDGPTTVRFIKDIAVRYGTPHNTIMDNGTNFAKGTLAQYCSVSGIRLDLASIAHPQTNDQVKQANHLILSGIKPRLVEPLIRSPDNWLDEPPTSTGFTPFFLVYGAEVIILTDIEFDSPRVTMYTEAQVKESRDNGVDLLEEERLLGLS
ncbi:uncharacterized protein [Aegilops tauschii subsp. strangulata]|uniref:uncharacterized protein n=1 Tax=Aegilops tauschii subsp. strangulata TaxID=200361 RepID=UPI003CC8BABF